MRGSPAPRTSRNASGTLPGTGSRPSVRGGGPGADRGGPGDSPASVAWLARERTGHTFGPGAGPRRAPVAGVVDGRPLDPDSGIVAPPARAVDRLGRPRHFDPYRLPPTTSPGAARGGRTSATRALGGARLESSPAAPVRGGSVAGLSPWERWLELALASTGFPRHLSIHTGGMLVTAAPLIDIAPLERATMPGRVVRPVRQA